MTCHNAIGIAQNDARKGEQVNVIMMGNPVMRMDNPCGVLPCPDCGDGLLYYSQSEQRWLECALCGNGEQ